MNRFPIRMARREARAATGRGLNRSFLIFFACIALGVGALVGVGSFAAGLDRTLAGEAKTLMGGDLALRSHRPLGAAVEAHLDRLRNRGAAVTRIVNLAAMVRDPAGGRSLLTELKAVEASYPLYGRVDTLPEWPLHELLEGNGALVQDTLLARLGLSVGERLAIGAGRFTITGVIRREPDRATRLFSLGPRVLIAATALRDTALVRAGSHVHYHALVRLPESFDLAHTRTALMDQLTDPTVRVTAYDQAQPGLRRFFAELTTYLGLVGLVSLLVGGIGVAATICSFIEQKRLTIAILKSLGAESGTLLATYLGQALALGLLGSVAGAGLGVTVQALLAWLLAGFLPFELPVRLFLWPVVRGLAMGLGTTLLCALWPLAGIRTVPPAAILRRPVETVRPRGRRPPGLVLAIAAGLAGLALWQAGSLAVWGLFVLALVAALAALAGVGQTVIGLVPRLPRLPWVAWRQGLANLRRPGDQSAGVVVALGLGVMLVVSVALLETNLSRQLDHERHREAPSFFFVDIQPDQTAAFVRTVSAVNDGSHNPMLVPVVRARLSAVNGTAVTRETWEGRDDAWRFTREYVLTFAATPPSANALTKGRWWTETEARAAPRISVEAEAAQSLGVDVGGTLTFDVQGVPVEAEVMSLRAVDWQSLSANFFVVFSPGALDGAPLTYLATARVPRSAEPTVQDAVTAAFPNVTAIPVRDLLERISRVLGQLATAVRLIALFVIGAGLVVMGSALTASRYQRLHESILLRTLGASRGTVARVFAVEYALLGATAGIAGTGLGALLAWIVLRFVLDVPWTAAPGTLALGVAFSVGLAVTVGALATYRLLGRKPLSVLRQE